MCDETISLEDMAPNRNVWAWPLEVFQSHDISDGVETSYNVAQVQQSVGNAVKAFNSTATQPVSATITFNEAANAYEVVPEVLGTALDEAAVISNVTKAMENVQATLALPEECYLKPAVLSSDPRMTAALAAANKMIQADVSYTYDDVEVARVDPSLLSSWVTLDADCNATLDTEKLEDWISTTAESLDTMGSERTYTRSDGKVITVSGGDYGWEVDEEAFAQAVRDDVAEGAVKSTPVPCTYEGEGFTKLGGADWGARYIDVDLSDQYVYFYGSDGSIIWSAPCISGAPQEGRATPTGVYYIKMKESPSKLIGYKEDGVTKDYETTVTYWMPFVGNAVGFHDATWQPSFGGTMYADGYGSHGCVNLSYDSAESLYSIIQPNDVVVVHN